MIVLTDYHISSLSSLVDTVGESAISKHLSTYRCARDSEREDYLHNKAITMEKRQMSRTYLALGSDGNILGYFTIGMKCMHVPDETPISNSTRKKMNIDDRTGVAQSYLLGQLGRDDRSEKGFGRALLQEALGILCRANKMVGCRLVRLDCADELVNYYGQTGFFFVGKNESENLNQLAILI
ncbi:hypothetical protein TALC_00942 [Thermoplasmatales archaeon BRNA1]|nr:hypothetical protein TALC_00942 [Thermoplasmatales archaeon BRNA1]